MAILVTGGAGYIGAHTVLELRRRKYKTVVIDDLSEGHRQAVEGVPLVVGDIRDQELTGWVMSKFAVEAIVHFAANSIVSESMEDPRKYYENNIGGTMSLMQSVLRKGIKKIVFSSTAAVYGEATHDLITEESPKQPTNVYGRTKLFIEDMLFDYSRAYGIKCICLRYFNACGADCEGNIGEDHEPETHLIPIVLSAAQGKIKQVMIYGTDYPTPDGTCIRDYIHVSDLARAHVLALEALDKGLESRAYNLGTGHGFSVREVISKAEEVTGQRIKTIESDRRRGDPPILVASPAKIYNELGWEARHRDLKEIIATAWKWHSMHPTGFKKGKEGKDLN